MKETSEVRYYLDCFRQVAARSDIISSESLSAIYLALWLLFTLCIICIVLVTWINDSNDDDDESHMYYNLHLTWIEDRPTGVILTYTCS